MSNPAHHLRPVMIVDQDVDHLVLSERKLTAAGVNNPLLTFHDSHDAIAYLQQLLLRNDGASLPGVIFTELRLPGIDGFGLIEWVRAQPGLAQVNVVPLTCSENLDDIERAKSAGASEFLRKFPPDQMLIDIIAAASHRSR